ncbi:MAG: MoaD/ThiS family protein [Lutispora sp.]|nr:MoaD/ThiS family protein [Lutispora sp.]MDD4833476.1 MoaD/ThiS family protein [Lutispora sp.]
MDIKVKLFAYLREGRDKVVLLDMNEGDTIKKAVKILNIDPKEISILLINGRDANIDSILVQGDTVSIFPPVGGG